MECVNEDEPLECELEAFEVNRDDFLEAARTAPLKVPFRPIEVLVTFFLMTLRRIFFFFFLGDSVTS